MPCSALCIYGQLELEACKTQTINIYTLIAAVWIRFTLQAVHPGHKHVTDVKLDSTVRQSCY